MNAQSFQGLPSTTIGYVIHHMFLPPKLPQADDSSPDRERALVNITINALQEFENLITDDRNGVIASVTRMVTTMNETLDDDGAIDGSKLSNALSRLPEHGGTILLNIRAQNAGVMIGVVDRHIHIESFELSPLNESVLTTKGRLRRSFPGPAVALSIDAFEHPDFQATVAHTLAKMSHQPALDTRPKARKAGQTHDEGRDTTHPKIVTELFMGFLGPVGAPVEVSRLSKNTREEVMWLDALLPWRRSPVWMLLRVGIQLTFSRLAGGRTPSAGYYKIFMAFLLAEVLQLSLQFNIPCDLLYAMNAKLGRRLLKLNLSADGAVIAVVKSVMHRTASHIRSRWERMMGKPAPHYNLSKLKNLDFKKDVLITLVDLTGFIGSLSTWQHRPDTDSFQPTLRLAKHQANSLPTIPCASDEYAVYNLKAFESWVSSSLPQWLEQHKGYADTCRKLGALIVTYFHTASRLYSGNPESYSILILSIIELWVACDQSALHQCSFLQDYDPGVPYEVLHALILPFGGQMQRLLRVEEYLKHRRNVARYLSPSIFRDYGESYCFAVRYFNQSSEHQRIRDDIVIRATQDRDAKVRELHRKQDEYQSLMDLHHQSRCEYYEADVREQRHSVNCKRCNYKSRADCIDINIHEWPLPRNDLEAKSTVFELSVPPFFGHWRDTALFLLVDILQAECPAADTPRASHPLKTYSGLSCYFVPLVPVQRLSLLSENKPHGRTHRRKKLINATTQSDVCLNNGLRYRYFDDATHNFIGDIYTGDNISTLLTYQLPESSPTIQQFLNRPSTAPSGPPPNAVIASQSDCPGHMSLEEYKALCIIPLGYRIQWHNILVQLAVPSIDFKKVETSLVILQSIYQAGPPEDSNFRRGSHEVLGDGVFALALLKRLGESLQRVRENWESSQAVSTFLSVAARLLSLTSLEDIKAQCRTYLRDIRAVTFDWVNLLMEKAEGVGDDSHRAELNLRAAELALICTDTFNVDDKYLENEFSFAEHGSVFLQCCIHVQSGTAAIMGAADPMLPILHQRWKSLCYRAYPILAKQILVVGSPCLDDAMKRTWSSYETGEGWRQVSSEFDHWLLNTLSLQSSDRLLEVHYNLLTGGLLVDGLPLTRLPSKYRMHPMYRTLFGLSDLEIVPSSLPGMQFSAKRDYTGYSVHLNMRPSIDAFHDSGHDFMVQAMKDGRPYILIPARVLQGKFPSHFTTDFVHWYNTKDDCVEFRPISKPWNASPNSWRLIRKAGHGQWRLVKGGLSLISVLSETARVISDMLFPLELPLRLHSILHLSTSALDIELPRLSLAFSFNSETLLFQSKQFRGLAIDPDQRLGTLVGLHSKLILKDGVTGQRSVIIPEGLLARQRSGDHVHVTINNNTRVKCHIYPVDNRLGRLLDNGTLQSKLWLCYLHAITSFCLVDPLTQRTGTEQALTILGSAAVRSFDRLHKNDIDLLEQIARLTAGRHYYPAHERVMQTVKWDPELSFLAQHGDFYQGVKVIFEQAQKMRVFYPGSHVKLPTLGHIMPDLLDRDRIRSATFRVSGFGAEDHTSEYDTAYSARDQVRNSLQAFNAFVISSFVFNERQTIHHRFPPGWSTRVWKFLVQESVTFGPGRQLPLLMYDAGLLRDWAEIVAEHWCAFHRMLTRTDPRFNKFRLMIWLSTIVFAKNCDIEIVQSLGAFFALSRMADISPPEISSFQLSNGAEMHAQVLRSSLKPALRPFAACPEVQLPRASGESQFALRQRQQRQFQSKQDHSINQFIKAISSQWPCESPVLPGNFDYCTYMNTKKAMQIVRLKFKTWYDNYRLKQYLNEVEDSLQGVAVVPMVMPSSSLASPTILLNGGLAFVSVDDIFTTSRPPPPPLHSSKANDPTDDWIVSTKTNEVQSRLPFLLEELESHAGSDFEMEYIKDLRASFVSLQSWETQYQLLEREDIESPLSRHLKRCTDCVQQIYAKMRLFTASVGNSIDSQSSEQIPRGNLKIVEDIGQCPRLCPMFFLQQLGRHRWPKITDDWRCCIAQYALALADLQRIERLVGAFRSEVELIRELRNRGHTNWEPINHPESLLLEVESGILIRDVQEEIAAEMRDIDENATMQLNMGEGKSSVIIPVVAAALADGTRLVRIITAKPQAKQMFQMLVSKLGGLLDRQVYHMPFSRSLRPDLQEANMIGHMCRECMTGGGVLLVQPEHILSFKLMGLEYLITGKETIGRSLLCTQDFLDASSRDIVDESDDNFSVKFELVYTMGMQQPVELSPQRWTCIQRVCELVKTFAPEVAREAPGSMEVYAGPQGGFPSTRILTDEGQRQLFTRVAKSICENGMIGFPISRQPKSIRDAVLYYLTECSPSRTEVSRVECQEPGGFWTESTSKTVLLLRGLFAGGIMSFALRQKRWRVQYGLDPRRKPPTKLAVPYRAKDSPTSRSEFSHPDVVIVLTCLSHYYGGLDDDDMFLAFDHLLKSYHADIEYQEWVKDAPHLPAGFRQLSGINLKDRVQCIKQVFPPLRHAKNAIDYFLAHLIFPKEMREFPHKLSASGWDIGQIKTFPTSGFSGTSDSRMTLPLGMTHLDLPEQKHTNALVLEYLLRPENHVLPILTRAETNKSTAENLLDMVTKMEPPAQVILDVGAQILELSNREVARDWLKRTKNRSHAQAVVFFNEDDELSVLDRTGQAECLQTSPFADQLDVCLVFLDEAHTRGTDLRLPDHYKAAVTLGANLTKDRLVQACMRMRKLGHGQSVVFCVPEEIGSKLLLRKNGCRNKQSGVSDVLCWSIRETWADIRQNIPLWAVQGRRFERQQGLWAVHRSSGESVLSRPHAEKFLEDEAQSLEYRYRPGVATSIPALTLSDDNQSLQRIANRLLEYRALEHKTASLREEQERELSPEIVQERQLQRPAPLEPAKHLIHPDLVAFVVEGTLKSDSEAFVPAFETLRWTSAASHINVAQFPRDVLTTIDFASTVQACRQPSLLDAYQRSVQWILTSVGDSSDDLVKHLVVISPFEAQMLHTELRNSRKVTLHLYAPRTNLGIRPVDDLELYRMSAMLIPPTLPSCLITQLNVFAGQFYMDSFGEYVEICTVLGLAWQKADDGSTVAADGFIIRDRHGQKNRASGFSESPVTFLRILMTKIRKNCEEVDRTHIGAVLGGRVLLASEFAALEK